MNDLLSIPSLASHLGVTPPAVRAWIKDGLIPEPSLLTASGERAFEIEAVSEIESWFALRASTHSTRGPGASARRERANAYLNHQTTEQK